MAAKTDAENIRNCLLRIVDSPHASALVAAYFQLDGQFAGAMFDGLTPDGLLANNPPTRFTVEDIAAASLLDVRFGPVAVRELLASEDIKLALKAVPADVPLWEMDDDVHRRANELWNLVIALPGVGGTRTSKLLARKRPHLIPIVDSVIVQALGMTSDVWRPLAKALSDSDLRRTIDSLRPPEASKKLSTLRLMDVAVWMACSRSTAAVMVQLDVGATPTRQL